MPSPTEPQLPRDLERRLETIIELDATAQRRALDEIRREHPALGSVLDRWQAAARMFERDAFTEPPPPERIGPYTIGRTLGQGGMGTVYLVEQSEPIERHAALKLIKPGMCTKAMLSRFDRERQALAVMNHESIARVFDAGSTEGGQPYFVMEYVEGEPITSYCDRRQLPLRERLALIERVCSGVQHAHQKGVVHRDLKPQNVLVTECDGRAVPKIIDFGLARELATSELSDRSLVTIAGEVIGTPAYMSPEQTRPESDVDTRTDVWALGVMLYELTTGSLPFETTGGESDLVDYHRRIREEEPARPSRRLAQHDDAERVAALRGESVRSLTTCLERDLDWVVMTALEKDAERRYASAGELGADIARFLACEPVLARAPTLGYRVRKFVSRYRFQTAAVLTVLALLVVGLPVIASLWADAARSKFTLEPFELIGLADEAERDLWPAREANVPDLERWLDEAGELARRIDSHREYVEELAATRKDDPRARARYREQRKLLARMEQILDPVPTARNIAGVRERLAWARSVRAVTVEAHRERWDRALRAIAQSEAYGGLRLEPQVGLIPLGADPESRLHEFYHPASGAPDAPLPERRDGVLALGERAGHVFVLIPGGTFAMGTRAELPHGKEADERPVHRVALSPFFLAKYETTQAQWQRLAFGDRPAFYGIGYDMGDLPPIGPRNPVELVTWTAANEVCRRNALVLPTEAQWEYACRAGSNTRFAWGDDASACERFENVADAFAAGVTKGWPGFEAWQDGHVVHAPVGSFEPNAFGLHDMHGNVRELCADWKLPYTTAVRDGDGLRMPPPGSAEPGLRAVRGGCWQHTTDSSGCADRMETDPDQPSNLIGFRPARVVR